MNCSNYEVHISGTSSPYSGRLEICYQNTWFGICSDNYHRWNYEEPMDYEDPMNYEDTIPSATIVACHSMGYTTSSEGKRIQCKPLYEATL